MRVGAVLTLSPRGAPKDSPAPCWPGCRLDGDCPFKSIMAAAQGDCFDGSEGRGLPQSRDLRGRRQLAEDPFFPGGEEVCVLRRSP